jgi:multiple sugar transport system substrate-binding protein
MPMRAHRCSARPSHAPQGYFRSRRQSTPPIIAAVRRTPWALPVRPELLPTNPRTGDQTMKLKLLAAAATIGAALTAAAPALAQEKLVVWWGKGFYKAEDEALFAAIKKFEAKYPKYKVELSLYAPQEAIPKAVAALDAGNPPDVAYGDVFDFQVTAKWAYEGKLEDITTIIEPIQGKFEPRALSTTFLYNNADKKRAYYAYPIKQQTMHIQYWKDMLADAGFKASDIPTGWKDYWSFWCEKVQPAYRQKTGQRGFSTGFPMGVDSSDSFYSFLTFMDAYNVKLVSDSGKLLVDDPAVRQGLINAMNDYVMVYQKGCTPPSATNWKDPDNNVAFHNKTIVLTHNATISIAAKWLDDMNNQTLTEAQRAQAKKNYTELIATAGFPNKPDGSKMTYRAAVKTGVIFKGAKNMAGAKTFVAFMLDESNLGPYVEGSLGRWFPVTKAGQQSAFWKNDPHRLAVYNQFMAGTTPFEFTKNYKFTVLNNENVWAKTMNRILNEKVPTDKAVDEMIARIKVVAAD